MLASRLVALRLSNSTRFRSVRLNAWATLIPPSSSASVADTSPIDSWRFLKRPPRDGAEERRHRQHHRDDEQRHQRELPVDPQHESERRHEGERGGQEATEPLGQKRVDLLDVVDEPAHQVAGLDGLEVAHVELGDLGEHVAPDLVECQLAGGAQREYLHALREPTDQRGTDEQQRGNREHRCVAAPGRLHGDVDQPARQRRRGGNGGRGDDEPRDTGSHLRPVREQIAQQADRDRPHRLGLVLLRERPERSPSGSRHQRSPPESAMSWLEAISA